MKNYKTLKTQLLKNKEIKKNYENLRPEFELARLLIKKRLEKGLTQKELAKKIDTKQSAISRLESGNYNPSINFLKKVIEALGGRLKVMIK